MRRIALVFSVAIGMGLLCLVAVIVAPGATTQTAAQITPAPNDPVIAGAGDIANSGAGDEATAKLLDSINPTVVYTTGDNAYPDGTLSEFQTYYEPTWGRHKAKTKPSPGNHEHHTSGASGYYDYFGAAAGERGKGYYSYDVGEWHLIALNSSISMGATSEQVGWLKNDLAAHTNSCTLAYFHHPLFSSGDHGNQTQVKPLWDALYSANADVVLNGHDHSYERFAPQNPSGTLDTARGIREFVVGTGGASYYPFDIIKPNSEARSTGTHGVLKLTLHAGGYDWQFIPEAGKTFTDSGSDDCHDASVTPPNAAPVARNNSYRVNEDRTLRVRPRGVLKNDSDSNADPLTARRVTRTKHGRLTLRANGSLVYKPKANFNGVDTFFYRAFDSKALSNKAKVTIRVQSVAD